MRPMALLSSILAVNAADICARQAVFPGYVTPSTQGSCEVLVLGAGLGGLSTAMRVAEETDLEVCVFEANNRVGGRTYDHLATDCVGVEQYVELGAQWIAQRSVDEAVWDLAFRKLHLGIHNGDPWGLYGLSLKDYPFLERFPFDGEDPATTFFGPDAYEWPNMTNAECIRKVADAYNSVVQGAPWETPNAKFIDSLTPLQWMKEMGCNITWNDVKRQGFTSEGKAIAPTDSRNFFPPNFYVSMTSAGSSGQEIFQRSSALWWLHNIKSNNGTLSMTYNAQLYRIVGGPQQMSLSLYEIMLAKSNVRVFMNSPVTEVIFDKEHPQFRVNGTLWGGKYVAITGTPVALNTHVTWTGSAAVAKMLNNSYIGNYNKNWVFFNEGPFWEYDKQAMEEIMSTEIEWPMVYYNPTGGQQDINGTEFVKTMPTLNSPARQRPNGRPTCSQLGALMSFGWPNPKGQTGPERAQGWYDVLPENISKRISSVFGQAWGDEKYIMGAYAAWWAPGAISTAGSAWSSIDGNALFCGSEWSPIGAGYMNGAIHRGNLCGDHIVKESKKL
eukprot:TRINITY_DN18186_c0_g1_i1.p1 TRINITY_DN18186_c0_g1~~TRINITY_DN18186_c0_g1_i1.p1  ORF type:complete len:580 (+),score=110.34 TRINITY_DN18186_c0_g1_i1:73-1740(+)